ncbi:MAG TPA: helix-turn-helix domain-containing protein [Fimbriimonadaceae bacterium]
MSTVTVKPIRTEADYDEAVTRIELVWGSAEGTPEGDELDVLLDLVAAYDAKHRPRLPLHPLKVIHSRMEDLRLKGKDVASRIGMKHENLSAILNGKRPLTLKTLLPLAYVLSIGPELLIGPTPKVARMHLAEMLKECLVNPDEARLLLNDAWLNSPTAFTVEGSQFLIHNRFAPGHVALKTKSKAAATTIADAAELFAYVNKIRRDMLDPTG